MLGGTKSMSAKEDPLCENECLCVCLLSHTTDSTVQISTWISKLNDVSS